jgi:hypothetical protein
MAKERTKRSIKLQAAHLVVLAGTVTVAETWSLMASSAAAPAFTASVLPLFDRYWQEDPANYERFPLFVSVDAGHHKTVQFAAAFNYLADVQVRVGGTGFGEGGVCVWGGGGWPPPPPPQPQQQQRQRQQQQQEQ